jgi:uncharacterized membrane protein YGL010W
MKTDAQARAERRIDRLLAEYGESHRHPLNKAIHWVCVPVIAWTLLALLWALPVPAAFAGLPLLNWATVVAALAILYYLLLSVPLALGMVAFASVSVWLITAYQANFALPVWEFALGVFAAAWVLQFIGHAVEGKRPSFFKDVQFLLIGPAWLMHFIFRRFGIAY